MEEKLDIDIESLKEMVMSTNPMDTALAIGILKDNRNKISIEDVCEVLQCVFVKGGTYDMGATPDQGDNCSMDEYPVHKETVEDHYCCKYDCTQGLWEAVMENNPSFNKESALHPVERVSWDDCQKFISWCNENIIPDGYSMALPTEAIWEYDARGGRLSDGTKYAGSNDIDEVGWHSGNSDGRTHAVGLKKPNELGLYDMTSNVLNWCDNWYEEYKKNDK